MHVYLPTPPPDPFTQRLREALDPGIRVTVGPDTPTPDYAVLVCGRPEVSWLENSPELRAVIIPFAGVPEATLDLLRPRSHLSLHNLHHNAAATAELALSLLLAAAKRLVPLHQALSDRDWRPRYAPAEAVLLEGRTALILGYGAIGRRIARGCAGLGMRVLATRRRTEAAETDGVAEVHPTSALNGLLPQADVLAITLPLTEATRNLVGAPELARLPRGAILVNVGRGPVVCEQALYDALRAGTLGAAGIDVWYRYPRSEEERRETAPAEIPLHELPNVVLSPHRGGLVHGIEEIRAHALAKALNGAAGGQPLPNAVDLNTGY